MRSRKKFWAPGGASRCSSNEPSLPMPEPATPAPSVTASPTPTPTPEPEAGPYKMGKQVTYGAGGATLAVQAITYRQRDEVPDPLDEYKASETWGVAEVRVCNVKADERVTVSQFPWSLSYSDGTVIEVTGSTGGNLPKPEYPMDKVVKVGRCVRGKITFVVPRKERPEFLVYEPDSGLEEESQEPVEWEVP